jgi:hypothetical protein
VCGWRPSSTKLSIGEKNRYVADVEMFEFHDSILAGTDASEFAAYRDKQEIESIPRSPHLPDFLVEPSE